MGFEPMNTGFAVRNTYLFSITCRNYATLYGTVNPWMEFSQWCENGVIATLQSSDLLFPALSQFCVPIRSSRTHAVAGYLIVTPRKIYLPLDLLGSLVSSAKPTFGE